MVLRPSSRLCRGRSALAKVHSTKQHRAVIQRPGQTHIYMQRNRHLNLVDELAGASLRTTAAMSTAPQYMLGGSLGSLGFHHALYALGATHPFRPIVIRSSVKLVGKMEFAALRRVVADGLDGGCEVDDAAAAPLPPTKWVRIAAGGSSGGSGGASSGSRPSAAHEQQPQHQIVSSAAAVAAAAAVPRVPFEVTRRVALDALCVHQAPPPPLQAAVTRYLATLNTTAGDTAIAAPQEHLAPSNLAEASKSRAAALDAELLRAPHLPWTTNGAAGAAEEGILVPLHPIVVTIAVPEHAVAFARASNERRAVAMAAEGRRRSADGFAVGGLDIGLWRRVHHVLLQPRDALFVPREWPFAVSVAPRASIVLHDDDDGGWGPAVSDGLAASTSELQLPAGSPAASFDLTEEEAAALRLQRVGTDAGAGATAALLCLRHVYHAFPRLTAQQRHEYMPSEFVTRIGDFYERGGNREFRQHR